MLRMNKKFHISLRIICVVRTTKTELALCDWLVFLLSLIYLFLFFIWRLMGYYVINQLINVDVILYIRPLIFWHNICHKFLLWSPERMFFFLKRDKHEADYSFNLEILRLFSLLLNFSFRKRPRAQALTNTHARTRTHTHPVSGVSSHCYGNPCVLADRSFVSDCRCRPFLHLQWFTEWWETKEVLRRRKDFSCTLRLKEDKTHQGHF